MGFRQRLQTDGASFEGDWLDPHSSGPWRAEASAGSEDLLGTLEFVSGLSALHVANLLESLLREPEDHIPGDEAQHDGFHPVQQSFEVEERRVPDHVAAYRNGECPEEGGIEQ